MNLMFLFFLFSAEWEFVLTDSYLGDRELPSGRMFCSSYPSEFRNDHNLRQYPVPAEISGNRPLGPSPLRKSDNCKEWNIYILITGSVVVISLTTQAAAHVSRILGRLGFPTPHGGGV